jgi:hypothetical protein
MQATIDFFEGKGLARIKEDDHERRWYADFLEFVQRQKLFATLLTPPDYAPDNPGAAWDTYRAAHGWTRSASSTSGAATCSPATDVIPCGRKPGMSRIDPGKF